MKTKKTVRINKVSIVILTYNRPDSLNTLLKYLSTQELGNIEIELILINNYPKRNITLSKLHKTGRLLSKFKDVKIINTSYNWGPGIRYPLTLAAKHNHIIYFDDDIHPINNKFLYKFVRSFESLKEKDILTCWADLWIKTDTKILEIASVDFYRNIPKKITEVDYCGTGICMFNKKILTNEKILKYAREYPFADTAWFPYLTTIIFGTRKYYFPSYNMLKFHDQRTKNAICLRAGYDKFIYSKRKEMWLIGYRPALTRKPDMHTVDAKVLSRLPKVKIQW